MLSDLRVAARPASSPSVVHLCGHRVARVWYRLKRRHFLGNQCRAAPAAAISGERSAGRVVLACTSHPRDTTFRTPPACRARNSPTSSCRITCVCQHRFQRLQQGRNLTRANGPECRARSHDAGDGRILRRISLASKPARKTGRTFHRRLKAQRGGCLAIFFADDWGTQAATSRRIDHQARRRPVRSDRRDARRLRLPRLTQSKCGRRLTIDLA